MKKNNTYIIIGVVVILLLLLLFSGKLFGKSTDESDTTAGGVSNNANSFFNIGSNTNRMAGESFDSWFARRDAEGWSFNKSLI